MEKASNKKKLKNHLPSELLNVTLSIKLHQQITSFNYQNLPTFLQIQLFLVNFKLQELS
jgi:hypothetical protein